MSAEDVGAAVKSAVADAMAAENVADAVKGAVADATNAVTLAAHMAQCEKDKAEIKAEQLRMHGENKDEFDKLKTQNSKIMRFVWIAAGAATTISFLTSSAGSSMLGKLVKVSGP